MLAGEIRFSTYSSHAVRRKRPINDRNMLVRVRRLLYALLEANRCLDVSDSDDRLLALVTGHLFERRPPVTA
jgi:hypothetical protein